MNEAAAGTRLLERSRVHPQWRPLLEQALHSVDADYLQRLIDRPDWLPGPERLFAAFRRDRSGCRYLLFGESPYPRAASANGIAFQDAAVDGLWSDNGLSKAVNRATSLRNLIKTALLAEGHLEPLPDGSIPQPLIAAVDKRPLITTLDEFFTNLSARGVLAFNALPVLTDDEPVARAARRWEGFIARLLEQLAGDDLRLILWGKVAERIRSLPAAGRFTHILAEHPYNISFIHNPRIQRLFAEWQLLRRTS